MFFLSSIKTHSVVSIGGKIMLFVVRDRFLSYSSTATMVVCFACCETACIISDKSHRSNDRMLLQLCTNSLAALYRPSNLSAMTQNSCVFLASRTHFSNKQNHDSLCRRSPCSKTLKHPIAAPRRFTTPVVTSFLLKLCMHACM